MERKSFQNIEFKALEDGRTIEGYGAVFGNLDSHGDIIVPGAFKSSERVPRMLWQHDFSTPIGIWESVVEDDHGLRVTGKFANTQKANEALELIKMGAVGGLSIGYRTIQSEDTRAGRMLKQIDLYEISVVTLGSNDQALIDTVKAASMTIREAEERLRDAGFSSTVAKKLLSGGFSALSPQRDAEELELEEVKKLLQERNYIISTI